MACLNQAAQCAYCKHEADIPQPVPPLLDYDAARANLSRRGSPAERKEGSSLPLPHAGIGRVDALGPPSAERPIVTPPFHYL